jgi:hypothetical protein
LSKLVTGLRDTYHMMMVIGLIELKVGVKGFESIVQD